MQTEQESHVLASKLFSAFFIKEHFLPTEIAHSQVEGCDFSMMIYSILYTESKQLKIPFKLYATQFFLQALDKLIEGELSRDVEKTIFAVSSKLLVQEYLDIEDVQVKVNNCCILIPPDIILELDKIGIVSFLNYFQACSESSSKTSQIADFIVNSACNLALKQETAYQLHPLLTSIIQIGFGYFTADVQKTISGQTVKAAVLLVHDFTRKIWNILIGSPDKTTDIFEFPINCEQTMQLHLLSFQKCYLDQLVYLISYSPEVKATTAIKSQHEWTFFKSPQNVASFITQLLIPLEVEKVVEKIDEILNRYEINWKTLLLVVSTIQVCYFKGNRCLKALANGLVQRALENFHKELLLAAFLLARQMYAENTSSLQYGAWFSSIVSASTTSKQFAFLMKFLTNSVRHEPTWILLAHKNHPPTIPVIDNSRALWLDYYTLVRTRLEDLRQHSSLEQDVEDVTLVKEVDAAIAAYGKSRKIPSSVIEAAIFRKPYFINKFLPILLKPRQIPNPPDVREEFVEELKASGKLPSAPYEAYCIACGQVEQKSSEDLQSMDWKSSDESLNYRNIMSQIVLCEDIHLQSVLIGRFNSLLANLLPPPSSASNISFDPQSKSIKAKNEFAWKIAEDWVDSLQGSCFGNEKLDGLNRYFLAVCRYPTVIQSLYGLLWQFTHKRDYQNAEKIRYYGITIGLLCVNEHLLLPVHYQTYHGGFVQLLLSDKHLVINGAEGILMHLQLLYHAVSEARQRNSLGQLHRLSSVYFWLARRVSHSRMIRDYHKYVQLTMDGEFQKERKLTLKDWLQLEMTVSEPDKDVLSWSERSGYLQSVLEMDYREIPVSEKTFVLLSSIVNRWTQRPSQQADCSKDLLLLLQSLFNDSQMTSLDSIAWLPQFWQEKRNEQGKDVDLVLWSLVSSLPAYLLSRNSLNQPVLKSSLKTLIKFIEDDWRQTLTSGNAWFPYHVTRHLQRAIEVFQPLPMIPCLRFALQIHRLSDPKDDSNSWKMLYKALCIFHPLTYDATIHAIQWSSIVEVNLLVNQLIALVAVAFCLEDKEWPDLIQELGQSVSQNPDFLKGWKISFWTGNDSLLPWIKILPTFMINLLPFVILQTLISWSDLLLRKDLTTTVDYLEALISVNYQWLETTNSFFDLQNEQRGVDLLQYPAGKILDLATFGRLGYGIKKILDQAPVRALETLQQSPIFRLMESDQQTLVRQRCS